LEDTIKKNNMLKTLTDGVWLSMGQSLQPKNPYRLS